MDALRNTYYKKHGTTAPWHDAFTNPMGKMSYGLGSVYNKLLSPFTKKFYKDAVTKERIYGNKTFDLSQESFEHAVEGKAEVFARRYANASISYTPYFMMKSDVLSAFLDTKRTDIALDRTLNAIGTLNWGEFKAGLSEVFRAVRKEPFTDPKREVLAEAGMAYDTEKFSNEAYQLGYTGYVHGKNAGSKVAQKVFATDELKSARPTYTTLAAAPSADSWKDILSPGALDERRKADEKEGWEKLLTPEALEARKKADAGEDVNWQARQEAARKFSEEKSREGVSVH